MRLLNLRAALIRQISQDRFTLILAVFVAVACAAVAAAFYVMRGAGEEMAAAGQRQLVSTQLADELRQSSDDLTRLVRTYVETGDQRYKRAFQDVLAVRDGRLPRPRQSERLYWDLVLMDEASVDLAMQARPGWYARPRLDGPAKPLQQLMVQAGFTSDELSKLAEAERRSTALAVIENQAIALIEGQPPDPARARARALVFGHAYHAAKRDIMLPIDECGEMVARRVHQDVVRSQAKLSQAQYLFAMAVFVLLTVAVLMVVHVRSRAVALLGATPEHLKEVLNQLASGPLPELPDVVPAGALAKLHLTADRLRQLMRDNAQLEQDIVVRTAELKQVMDELIQNQTVSALGGLVAGVAHELNTPIGNAVLATSSMGDQIDLVRGSHGQGQLRKSELTQFLDESKMACAIVARNLHRAADLVEAFKLVAVDQASGRRHRFGLRKLVQSTLVALEPTIKKQDISIDVSVPADLELDTFTGALEQVLVNLINNSIVHGMAGRQRLAVVIEARRCVDHVLISVRDDGAGICPELQKRVFEPFFTTRLGAGGSGLGLYIVHQLVHVTLAGSLSLRSGAGAGTNFEIRLPLQPAPVKNPMPDPVIDPRAACVGLV